jgi:galactose mutarotase-like enzyme
LFVQIHGTDVALGYDDMSGYTSRVTRNPYFGAVVGRVANRIANGKFSLDGKEYTLAQVSFIASPDKTHVRGIRK